MLINNQLFVYLGMDLAAKFAQRNAAAQETAKGRKRAHQQQMKTFFTWYVFYCFHGKKLHLMLFVYLFFIGFAIMETHQMMKLPRSLRMICGKFELKILCEFTNFLLFVIFFQYNHCVISRFFFI